MTMERYVASKRNVFYFQTERGVFAIGAEDPNDVADSAWFREFLGLRKSSPVAAPQLKRELPTLPIELEDIDDALDYETPLPEIKEPVRVQSRPVVRPAQQAPVAPSVSSVMPQQQQTFMDVRPDVMTEEVWRAMSEQQKSDWRKKWLGM